MVFTIGTLKLILRSGAWIPVLIMLPNLVWMLMPKKQAAAAPGVEPLWLTIVENVGRAAILVIPFFYDLDFRRPLALPALTAMGLALVLYYACWVRYFAGGGRPELLGRPMLGIPLPMAVAPVLFLLLSAYLLGSWWMLGAALLFGAAHLWVSALTL